MKKFLLIIFAIFCISLNLHAETQWYKATSYAYKYINDYGNWTAWTDWIPCNVSIKIEIDDDIIVVYSKMKQIYIVTDYKGKYTDSGGGTYISYSVVDQDDDIGTIRLRIERNGNSQLYVDFANVMWVYNVERY